MLKKAEIKNSPETLTFHNLILLLHDQQIFRECFMINSPCYDYSTMKGLPVDHNKTYRCVFSIKNICTGQ
jgi:hypothetical protein